MNIKKYDTENFEIGSSIDLSKHQISALSEFFNKNPEVLNSGLNGRATIASENLDNVGQVVVKNYARGGFLKRFISRRYLKWGLIRSEREHQLLSDVRNLGINAPEPIAYAHDKKLLYRAWLVTKQISEHKNLAEIGLEDKDRAARLTQKASEQLGTLINNKIYHVDFHPGNVVADSEDNLYFVDFDKAHYYQGPKNKLRDLYLRRWRRAVIKHNLPEVLSEAMCLQLRTNFE